MALTKRNYVSGKTVITAENLNEIQDAIIALESNGGVGMGITGATVGQIAKIAAVDSDGVPTAWSPVDMPSGGGEELRLIRTINISSDALNSIYFNVDDENRPFNLHRVVIAMYGADTNTGSKQAAIFLGAVIKIWEIIRNRLTG